MNIPIEDGTIVNHIYNDHKRAKNWVATVESDKSQPGGLKRTFLDRGPGYRVLPRGLEAGMWLEFAGDYYSAGGSRSAKREYHKIVSITPAEIVTEAVEVEAVGKYKPVPFEVVEGTSPTDVELIAQARQLKNQLNQVEKQLRARGVDNYSYVTGTWSTGAAS